MNISATVSTGLVQGDDAVSLIMLRKTLDQQRAIAAQMIAAVRQPVATPKIDATVGRNVDTFA